MLLIKEGAKDVAELVLLENFRVVPNKYDQKGGVFIMFYSTAAPGESPDHKKVVKTSNNRQWKFWE